jgi:hypothetical protein
MCAKAEAGAPLLPPSYVWCGSNLAVAGRVRLDAADLAALESGDSWAP